MAEYIEREAAIDEIEGATWYHISCQKNLVEGAACEADALYKATDIYNVLKSAPIADVQEIKHGEWTKDDSGGCYCSACGWYADYDYDYVTYVTNNGLGNGDFNYCPHCGAKMDGGKK